MAGQWRRLPEPWRRRFFLALPPAASAGHRLQNWLRRAVIDDRPVQDPPATAGQPHPAATTELSSDDDGQPYFRLRERDVGNAYRLLLYRDPTTDEVDRHLRESSRNLEYDLYHFVDRLLASAEREQAVMALGQPAKAKLDGMTFYYRPIDTALGAEVAHYGTYEPVVAQTIERLLPVGGTFIDVGANIGLHSLRAARKVGPLGRVVAFEPSPGNVELLGLAMEANGFDHVTVRAVAASDRDGEVPLHARRGQSNATMEIGSVTWASDLQVSVPCVRLDDELADLERIDLLKIDIEGAEPLAFDGLSATLARLKPPILLEFFPDALVRTSGVEPADLLRTVESMGYQLRPFIPGEDQPTQASSVEAILPLPGQYRVTHIDILAEPA